METVKKTDEYEIIKKRSGRYGVRDAKKNWIGGDEKVKILLAEKLIKAAPPKKAPEPEPEEAATAADEGAESGDAEAPAEEASADAPTEEAAAEETKESE